MAVTILAHLRQIAPRVDLLREERRLVCEDLLDFDWLQPKQLFIIDQKLYRGGLERCVAAGAFLLLFAGTQFVDDAFLPQVGLRLRLGRCSLRCEEMIGEGEGGRVVDAQTALGVIPSQKRVLHLINTRQS